HPTRWMNRERRTRLKLNDDTVRVISERLATGDTLANAARAAGGGTRTLERWLARGRDARQHAGSAETLPASEQPYLHLLAQMEATMVELTDETLAKIAQMLAVGAEIGDAARSAGVSAHTLKQWMARAQAARNEDESGQRLTSADRVYVQLLEEIDRA